MITIEDIHLAKILIVDDQSVNVQLLEYLLTNTGYSNVRSTTDPTTVPGLHAEHRFDLIILDLHMPGMNGFQVMDALRPMETEAYLPVLVVTAEPEKKVQALDAGARDFVGKPFDPVEVLTRIRNMLEVRLLHRQARNYSTLLEQTVRERTAELQRFRSAMDATADAIFLIDAGEQAIVDVNDGACRMLALDRAALLAMAPAQLGLDSAAALAQAPVVPGGERREPDMVETRLSRADGVFVPVEVTWQRQVLGRADVLIAVARDITERVLAQQRLRHLASYDRLTGLPNRTLFYQTLREAIELAKHKEWRIAVLFISLDRFKIVNDSLGASLGDELLRQFSSRLVQCVRIRDTVGRLGGDEFGLVLTMSRNQQEAVQVANEVREALRAPFDLHGQQAGLTTSLGIAIYPDDARDPETLVRYADTAMVRAKEAGRDGYRFFTAGMNVQVLARLDLELALRRALEQGELALFYQPKVNLSTGQISGAEALLRWHRPGYGLVFPSDFIPVMEETGLIVRVGSWIIDEACRQIAAWAASGAGAVRVAVNVSSRQFVEGDLEADVRAAIGRHNIDPSLLELELTESALMTNAERTIGVLVNLKALGVKVAIDDFGTGYSSLAYLKRFPIDKLKIDIAFVRDITVNPDDAAIALAIISMAHSMKMTVIAEGVESRAQMAYLRRHRCDEIQGYYFSRPMPPEGLEEMLLSRRALPTDAAPIDDNRPTLLLVDSDPNVLSALHRLFRPDDYRILTAISSAEGFEQLALHVVHVIVCEQRLPGISGTEFLSKVKEMYPDTIRVILSGYTGLDSVLDAINRGAIYRFYTKPWDGSELRDNIRLAFQHYWQVNGVLDERRMPRDEDEALAASGPMPSLPSMPAQ